MSDRAKTVYTIQTVKNALCILEAISEETGEFRISDLSHNLGLSKSYIFRMLATMEQSGYVQHISSSGHYRTGISAYETGSKFLQHMVLLQKAKPVMAALAKETGEAVYLAVPGTTDILMIEMVDSPQQVRVMPFVGKRFSFEQFSAGKVILAFRAEVDKEILSLGLQVIQKQGASVDHGQVGDDISSLAVPILNTKGLACASLCLLAPEFRMTHERVEKSLLPLLKKTGDELSAKMGYLAPGLLRMCS